MIKAIIFDFDGVICDTFEDVFKIIKKHTPRAKREDLKKLFDGNIYRKIRYGIKLNITHYSPDFEELYLNLKIENEVKGELRELSKKFKLFILTSNIRKNIENVLKKSNMKSPFKEIFDAEDYLSKTKKFKLLFKEFNLKPEECIFITDTLGDIFEAKRAKVKTIACDFGYHGKSRLKKASPYKIVSSFKEIRKEIVNLT